ncbi:hypothetical protein VTH06DRAFT_5755 [Thermothelomyces fergusii]
MGHLSHDEFFSRLADIFQDRKAKGHGAVYLTQKRPKVKLSTVVQPDELEGFYSRYAEVCKAGMAALKPRDRTKRKAKAKKRKGMTAA